MANYNKVILVGKLTRDPQLTYLPSNTPVCEFGLAVNHTWKDRDGNRKEDVCFVDCRCFGKGGEILNQYTSKGRQILVEGRLVFQQWTAPDGAKRSKHLIYVDNFQFLDSRPGAGAPPPDGGEPTVQRGPSAPMSHEPAIDPGPPPPSDADIPF